MWDTEYLVLLYLFSVLLGQAPNRVLGQSNVVKCLIGETLIFIKANIKSDKTGNQCLCRSQFPTELTMMFFIFQLNHFKFIANAVFDSYPFIYKLIYNVYIYIYI